MENKDALNAGWGHCLPSKAPFAFRLPVDRRCSVTKRRRWTTSRCPVTGQPLLKSWNFWSILISSRKKRFRLRNVWPVVQIFGPRRPKKCNKSRFPGATCIFSNFFAGTETQSSLAHIAWSMFRPISTRGDRVMAILGARPATAGRLIGFDTKDGPANSDGLSPLKHGCVHQLRRLSVRRSHHSPTPEILGALPKPSTASNARGTQRRDPRGLTDISPPSPNPGAAGQEPGGRSRLEGSTGPPRRRPRSDCLADSD